MTPTKPLTITKDSSTGLVRMTSEIYEALKPLEGKQVPLVGRRTATLHSVSSASDTLEFREGYWVYRGSLSSIDFSRLVS